MAYTNYGTIQTAVMTKIGIDDTDVEDVVEQAINDIMEEICNSNNFSWLYDDSSFITTAPYSTGTLTATTGSTTLTGAGTTWTSAMAGRRISIEDAFYEISAYVSGTELTLGSNYAGAGGSELTYIIYQNEYSLSSDVEDVLSMYQENNPQKLSKVGLPMLDRAYPQRNTYSYPSMYAINGYDSSGNMKVEVYPIPNQARNIYYRMKKRVTVLSADSDEPIIPLRYRYVLFRGAVYEAADSLDMPDIAQRYERLYEKGLAKITKADRKIDERIIKGSGLNEINGNFLGSNYPVSPL